MCVLNVFKKCSNVCDYDQKEQKKHKPFSESWESSELEEECSVDKEK